MAQTNILSYFTFEHLPVHLQATSAQFAHLADWISTNVPNGPEKSTALRKLLESKDAAVRASLDNGGE